MVMSGTSGKDIDARGWMTIQESTDGLWSFDSLWRLCCITETERVSLRQRSGFKGTPPTSCCTLIKRRNQIKTNVWLEATHIVTFGSPLAEKTKQKQQQQKTTNYISHNATQQLLQLSNVFPSCVCNHFILCQNYDDSYMNIFLSADDILCFSCCDFTQRDIAQTAPLSNHHHRRRQSFSASLLWAEMNRWGDSSFWFWTNQRLLKPPSDVFLRLWLEALFQCGFSRGNYVRLLGHDLD